MKVYNYNPITKEYGGESIADESPLEPGVFLIPAAATTVKPPTIPQGRRAVWINNSWSIELIPPAPLDQ